MKKDYLNNLDELSNRIKNEAPKIPIQQIKAVKKKMTEDNGHFNIWIPKELLKQVKTFAVQEELSIREIGIRALELYLIEKSNSK